MAFEARLADRIEVALSRAGSPPERKPMFGGVAFMVGGHMACGLSNDEMHVRVGPYAYDAALEDDRARPMNVTGKVMKGWVTLIAPGTLSDDALAAWISRSLMFVRTLDMEKGAIPQQAVKDAAVGAILPEDADPNAAAPADDGEEPG